MELFSDKHNIHTDKGVTMRKVAVVTAALLLTATLASCSLIQTPVDRDDEGKVTSTAQAQALQIKVGDCVMSMDGTTVEDVRLVPCDTPHVWESYAAKNVTYDSFPGQTELGDAAEQFCGEEFSGFVGIDYDSSELDFTSLSPTSDSWEIGDRELMCFVGATDGNTTGSLKGSRK